MTKISTGVIVFCALSFLVFRKRLFLDKYMLIASIVNCLALFYAFWSTVTSSNDTFNIQFGSFYNEYIKGSLILYLFFQYWPALLLTLLIVILTKLQAKSYASLNIIFFNSTGFILIEIILISIFVGALPGLLIHIDGGSALYFSNVQFWFSSIAILSFTPYIERVVNKLKLHRQKIYYVSKKIAIICVVLIACKSLFFFLRNQVQIRNSLVFGNDYKQSEYAKSVSPGTLTHMVIDQLSHSGDYKKNMQHLKLDVLKSLRDLPSSIKSKSIVYCENLAELENVLTCGESTFYVTALTEMALINGLYWKDCFPTMSYGLDSYQNFPKEIDKQEAIKLAKKKGFLNVIFLDLKKESYYIERIN
ncbi:MAG: hypothetical protein ORN54_13010 [Cyclobacteriaceae bacterium]|nr:hypothetical protein [Cyclobacteriaceae bacterium]